MFTALHTPTDLCLDCAGILRDVRGSIMATAHFHFLSGNTSFLLKGNGGPAIWLTQL